MKRLFFIVYIVLFVIVAKAQQVGLYSHYFYKPLLYNPAFTGYEKIPNATIISKNQWSGFDQHPKLNIFTLDGKFTKKKIALGINLLSDNKGLTSKTGGSLFYSYYIKINPRLYMSLGVSLGMVSYTYNFSKAIVADNSDLLLSSSNQKKNIFDGIAGVGLLGKKFEFGLSVPQLIGSKVKFSSDSGSGSFYKQARQYLISGKYKFVFSEKSGVSISPLCLMRYTPHTPFQFDLGTIFDWKNKVWVGAIYKSGYALSANAGFTLYKRLSIGYSYDVVVGKLSSYSGLSHEIMLNYKFITKKSERSEREADSIAKSKLQELNAVLLKKLLVDIDAIFEKTNAKPEEYRELRERITEFSNSYFEDPNIKKTLKEYAKKLMDNSISEPVHITIKGQIALPPSKTKSKPDYSGITIRLIDKATGTEIGTYTPKSKNGKYILIIKPGEKYIMRAEKDGYQTYIKELAPPIKKTSTEMEQIIKLKPEKKPVKK